MSVIDVESLLKELSPEAPSGANLEYDKAFAEMERAAKGGGGQQILDTGDQPESPDWRQVKEAALDLMGRTRDLRVGVFLARALVHTDGISGLSDGLALLHGLLERHWDTVHPQLDPEDGSDPTIRVTPLATLNHPETMLRSVREAPLVTARTAGRFSVRDVLMARGRLPVPAGGAPPDPASVDAAMRECELDALQATANALGRSVDEVTRIGDILTEKVGAAQSIDLSDLAGLLRSGRKALAEELSRRGVAVVVEEGTPPAAPDAGPRPAPPAGEIASREDAIRVLEKVCDYFETHEPSSPVPILLRRAKRLVGKNFVEIVRDIASDAQTQVERLRGAEEGP